MKIRESGMPNEQMWESFFDLEIIFDKLQINHVIDKLVDFGCGYGTFTLPAAEVISENVIAFDIEDEMINNIKEKMDKLDIKNVEVIKRDFIDQGTGLQAHSVDYVMLFNILHDENPIKLLTEAFRILKLRGKLGIIHWNYDPNTPRGTPIAIRPKPEKLISLAEQVGFVNPILTDLKPYHYGILLAKENE